MTLEEIKTHIQELRIKQHGGLSIEDMDEELKKIESYISNLIDQKNNDELAHPDLIGLA